MAQYEEISIDQGSDVSIEIRLGNPDGTKKNLTGYSVAAQLRQTYNSSDSDAIDFTANIQDPATDGKLHLSLTNAQTDALDKKRYVYDVEISHQDSDDNTIIERVLQGVVNVNPSVTRG